VNVTIWRNLNQFHHQTLIISNTSQYLMNSLTAFKMLTIKSTKLVKAKDSGY